MRLKKIFGVTTLILVLGLSGCNKNEENKKELNISAASSLKEVMVVIEEKYNKVSKDIELVINYGGSGSLQKQIEQGAPCDVFISAGKSQMEELSKKGILLEDTYKDLLKNNLVLISKKNSDIDNIEDLASNSVKHIGVGEFKSVPAGKYTEEVLKNTNLYNEINDKLVFAKDVKEVLTWTKTGNTEAGFVYYSDTINNNEIKIIEKISPKLHSDIIYPISVIKDSKNKDEAIKFEEFLLSDEGQNVFKEFGYEKINN
ncbi:MAG: molybdate ABC transporter substrate-binding protein [Peptostreptococcaceae bacterium]